MVQIPRRVQANVCYDEMFRWIRSSGMTGKGSPIGRGHVTVSFFESQDSRVVFSATWGRRASQN